MNTRSSAQDMPCQICYLNYPNSVSALQRSRFRCLWLIYFHGCCADSLLADSHGICALKWNGHRSHSSVQRLDPKLLHCCVFTVFKSILQNSINILLVSLHKMQCLQIPSVVVYFSGSVDSLSSVNRLFTAWMGCCCIVGYVKVVCSIIWTHLVFLCCHSVLHTTVSQPSGRISNELFLPVICSSLDYSNCIQSSWGEEQAGLWICREPWEMLCVCQWKDRLSAACMHACIVLISFVMRDSGCLKENSGLSSRDLETVLFIALNRDWTI